MMTTFKRDRLCSRLPPLSSWLLQSWAVGKLRGSIAGPTTLGFSRKGWGHPWSHDGNGLRRWGLLSLRLRSACDLGTLFCRCALQPPRIAVDIQCARCWGRSSQLSVLISQTTKESAQLTQRRSRGISVVSREREAPGQAAWGSSCCVSSEPTRNEGKQKHPWEQALQIAVAQHLTEALKTGEVDPAHSRDQEAQEGRVCWKEGRSMGAVLGWRSLQKKELQGTGQTYAPRSIVLSFI